MIKIYAQHKKKQVLKYLSLFFGLVTLMLIIISSGHQNIMNVQYKPTSESSALQKEINYIVQNTVFEGLNKQQQPYKITARDLTKNQHQVYNLSEINVKYAVGQGELEVLAEHGILNEVTKQFELSNNVQLKLNGLTITSNKMDFDLHQNKVVSNSPVEIKFKNSSITAPRASFDSTSESFACEGGVVSVFNLEDF